MANTLRYTEAFQRADPTGSKQLDAEEAIAGQLFDTYSELSQIEHTRRIIGRVADSFCEPGAALPIAAGLDLFVEVYDYLGNWQQRLAAPNEGPDQEEAARAGKALLLLTLGVLRPECVAGEGGGGQ